MTLFSSIAPAADPVEEHQAVLAELTAVERFSQAHECEVDHRQARYYRDLIPLARPRAGEQYAFEVDLDACTGCKACVTACHSLNGLDDGEAWRTVRVTLRGTGERPLPQTVTAACHHCVEPACLAGCPVDAYEKDPVTGIVVHLDDQCIGCGYCTLTCPYEVPVLNPARGIVRKCDMCHGRLAAGEAPACVQACPNGAIAISIVDVAGARSRARASTVVPDGPPATITTPTTVYRTRRDDVDAVAPVTRSRGPATAHPPLAAMLVLTQLAVGAFAVDLAVSLTRAGRGGGPPRGFDAAITLVAGTLALLASVFHLGRPRYCYRAVIGLRHSWLSREVVAFGAFNGLTALDAAALVLRHDAAHAALAAAAVGAGVAGVACSVLIYTTTRRSSWRRANVAAKFAATSLACGTSAAAATTFAAAAVHHGSTPLGRWLVLAAAGIVAGKVAAEATVFLPRNAERARRARLLGGELRRAARRRVIGAATATGALVALARTAGPATWFETAIAVAACAAVVAGECAERSLFFTTASPPS